MAKDIKVIFEQVEFGKEGNLEDFTAEQRKKGWESIGKENPKASQFSQLFNDNDRKDNYLFNQIKQVILTNNANYVPIEDSVKDLLNAVDKRIRYISPAPNDTLTSTSTTQPLAANQGRVLDGKITDVKKTADTAYAGMDTNKLSIAQLKASIPQDCWTVRYSYPFTGTLTSLSEIKSGSVLMKVAEMESRGLGNQFFYVNKASYNNSRFYYDLHGYGLGGNIPRKFSIQKDGNEFGEAYEWLSEYHISHLTDGTSQSKVASEYAVSQKVDKAELSTQNLDEIKRTGIYGQKLTVNATTARNYPINSAGVLIHSEFGASGSQLYFAHNNGNLYTRGLDKGVWTNWTIANSNFFADKTAFDVLTKTVTSNYNNTVKTTGNQTVNGLKTFNNGIVVGSGSSKVTFPNRAGEVALAKDLLAYSALDKLNLNNVLKSGIYGQPLNADATTARNYPESEAGMLIVTEHSAYNCQQIYTCFASGNSYTRSRFDSDGNWNDWKLVNSNVFAKKSDVKVRLSAIRVVSSPYGGSWSGIGGEVLTGITKLKDTPYDSVSLSFRKIQYFDGTTWVSASQL